MIYNFIGRGSSMNFKLLMLVGLLIASAAVMPNVLAKFQGQHVFIKGKNVDCIKCHADVQQELQKSQIGGHISMGCRGCHVAIPELQGYKFHAAALVECIACHGKVPSEFTDVEGHKPFLETMNTTEFMAGANEACIACHTHGGYAELIEAKNYTVNAAYNCTDSSDITTCSWSFSISVE